MIILSRYFLGLQFLIAPPDLYAEQSFVKNKHTINI